MFRQRKILSFIVILLLLYFASYFIKRVGINKVRIFPQIVYESRQNNELAIRQNKNNESITTIYNKLNWTILLEVNNGAFELFRNWYSYFSKLDIGTNVTVIAVDDKVFKKLLSDNFSLISVHRSDIINLPNALTYNTPLFRQLMSVRATHLLKYLPHTRYLLFSDVDTVWLQNPIPYFKGMFDLWMPLDRKLYCAGFFAITTNKVTMDLIRKWEKALMERISVNQLVFNNLIQMSKNLKVATLNESLFPSGDKYFRVFNDQERSKAVIVHNNFIKGIDVKVARFKEFNLWNI